jgi:hypothetical protein
MSGQLYTLFPGKEPALPIKQETVWASELIPDVVAKRKNRNYAGNPSRIVQPTLLAVLSQFTQNLSA